MDTFDQITFEYDTGQVPPPFCHRYKIIISKINQEKYTVDLNLEYYDRDEITEDEIFDEGFSLDDNYTWQGDLPLVWGKEILRKLRSANLRKKPSPGVDNSEFIIKIASENQSEILLPDQPKVWEVLAQEIIQAIFELSKKEAPLLISFVSKSSKDENPQMDFEFSFAKREVRVNSKRNGVTSMDWPTGQKLLKYIFNFDYLPENSFDKIPKKPGNYINPGDGFWYELKPFENAGKNAIERIDKLVETLKSYD